MLSDDLTQMARDAGLHLPYWDDDKDPQSNPPSGWAMASPIGQPLERFARAVERAAYERAAQECDEWMKHWQATIGGPLGAYREGKADAASTLAERIRALGRQHEHQ